MEEVDLTKPLRYREVLRPSMENVGSGDKYFFVLLAISYPAMFISMLSLLIYRNVTIVLFTLIAVGFLAMMVWNVRRESMIRYIQGCRFLDVVIVAGDTVIEDQIPIVAYEVLALPEETIDGSHIEYRVADVNKAINLTASRMKLLGGFDGAIPLILSSELELERRKEREEIERRLKEIEAREKAKAKKREEKKSENGVESDLESDADE